MKKILSLILVLALALSLGMMFTSCGGDEDKGKDPGEVKAALIALHGTSSTYDKNFIEAFKTACKNKGLKEENYTIITDIPEGTECYDEAANFADEGYDVIFADSFGHESYMLQAAKEFPDVQFCHATGTKAHTENVANYQNAFASIYEGRYLAGVAAGLKLLEIYGADITAEEAKVGYVGAFPYAEVISGFTSWFLGVRSVVPNATMEVRYTNSWYNEPAEKATAEALIASGCKLISQYSDSMGAPTACENAGIPNVAYGFSTEYRYPNTYLCHTAIDWTPYFEYIINAVRNGDELASDWTGSINNGSVVWELNSSLDPIYSEIIESEIRNQFYNYGDFCVFRTSNFTVNGEHLTSYIADVDDYGDYLPDTEVIVNGTFKESCFRSAPYFDIIIDGITIMGYNPW